MLEPYLQAEHGELGVGKIMTATSVGFLVGPATMLFQLRLYEPACELGYLFFRVTRRPVRNHGRRSPARAGRLVLCLPERVEREKVAGRAVGFLYRERCELFERRLDLPVVGRYPGFQQRRNGKGDAANGVVPAGVLDDAGKTPQELLSALADCTRDVVGADRFFSKGMYGQHESHQQGEFAHGRGRKEREERRGGGGVRGRVAFSSFAWMRVG